MGASGLVRNRSSILPEISIVASGTELIAEGKDESPWLIEWRRQFKVSPIHLDYIKKMHHAMKSSPSKGSGISKLCSDGALK